VEEEYQQAEEVEEVGGAEEVRSRRWMWSSYLREQLLRRCSGWYISYNAPQRDNVLPSVHGTDLAGRATPTPTVGPPFSSLYWSRVEVVGGEEGCAGRKAQGGIGGAGRGDGVSGRIGGGGVARRGDGMVLTGGRRSRGCSDHRFGRLGVG
jgi:hypothetical protein